MVRWYWVNFQCRGVLLTWFTVGQGPIVLAVGAGGGCLDIFSLIYHLSFLSPSLWETARYRLKYCLKGPLSQKQTNKTRFLAPCPKLAENIFTNNGSCFLSHYNFQFKIKEKTVTSDQFFLNSRVLLRFCRQVTAKTHATCCRL